MGLLFMVIVGIVCAAIAGVVGWWEARNQAPKDAWCSNRVRPQGYGFKNR